MAVPTIPDGDALDGSETIVGRQHGKLRRFALSLFKGSKGDTGAKGDVGAKGDKGDAGTPKRIETYSASIVGSAGQASITYPAFTVPPVVDPKNALIGGQLYVGVASNVTTTSATLTYVRTRGTLLLTASAVEVAPAGTAVSANVIGN